MDKYKITNCGKRGIIINGKELGYNASIITDKAYNGKGIVCEKIEEKIIEKKIKKYKNIEESE